MHWFLSAQMQLLRQTMKPLIHSDLDGGIALSFSEIETNDKALTHLLVLFFFQLFILKTTFTFKTPRCLFASSAAMTTALASLLLCVS